MAATAWYTKALSFTGALLQMSIADNLSNYFADMSGTISVSFITGNRAIDTFQSNQNIINNRMASTDNTESIQRTPP